MQLVYRKATKEDIPVFTQLAARSWDKFRNQLTTANWDKLLAGIAAPGAYSDLLEKANSFVCEADNDKIAGMAFLVPSGHPNDIYDAGWSCIRLLTVDPAFQGQGIGKELTRLCIHQAKANKEKIIALHTSELMQNARHIYESMGFSIAHELEPRLGVRYWLYKLAL